MNKIKKTCRENKSGCDRWWSTAAPMIHRYGASVVFPIYDGHGNMVYTLSRGANDTFSLGNKRIYGAWGDLRHDGNPNAGPNTQYCANLGHKLDNESGLTYMRARYYEPWTGRFISEDPARDGWNWFTYASNSPAMLVDPDGESVIWTASLMLLRTLAQTVAMLGRLGLQAGMAGLRFIGTALIAGMRMGWNALKAITKTCWTIIGSKGFVRAAIGFTAGASEEVVDAILSGREIDWGAALGQGLIGAVAGYLLGTNALSGGGPVGKILVFFSLQQAYYGAWMDSE